MVIDALNRKLQGEASTDMPTQLQPIQEMERLTLDVVLNVESTFVTTLVIQLLKQDRVKEAQEKDPKLVKLKAKARYGEAPNLYHNRHHSEI